GDEHKKSGAYYQAVLDETDRMNGVVMQSVNGVVLTELKPEGLTGSILVPNAGLDRSNIEEGNVIGWPKDPVASASALRKALPIKAGVIVSDSGLCPRRTGVMAFALCVSGIDPLQSLIGSPDLFGQDIRITEEAIADQLATAANFLMGNANQSTPAAVIRGHGLKLTDTKGWVPGIDRERDIYHGVI
ncbi:MAG: coenzyme F420-0:L-glutamate ligase, partial [Candidatus Peribacteraceae bacterium]|nr:coenzyme F420-0:L-glutamate ligase [Candidatus Peribacteraceae bacterium]